MSLADREYMADQEKLRAMSNEELDAEIEKRHKAWRKMSIMAYPYWFRVAEWECAVNVRKDREERK